LICECALECFIAKQVIYVILAYVVYFKTAITAVLFGLCNGTKFDMVQLLSSTELPNFTIESLAPIKSLSRCYTCV
jgi:hypothetical protein